MSRKQLAILLTETGDFEAAERFYEQALATERQQLGTQHPETVTTVHHFAGLLRRTGDLARAEALFREVLEGLRQVFGDGHLKVGVTMNSLAAVLMLQGELEEAEDLLLQTLDIVTRYVGEEHRDFAVVLNSLGRLSQMKGDFAAARSYYLRSLEIARRHGHPGAAYPLHQLASLEIQAGKPQLAEPLLREALDLRSAALTEHSPLVGQSLVALGRCLALLGRFEEAEALLVRSHRAAVAAGRPEGPSLGGLVELYEAWDRPDRAAEMRTRLASLPAPEPH